MRTGPDYLQLYPTLQCDRSCDFCFNRFLPPHPDMRQQLFERMLDRLPSTVTTIDIMGGEPTLHPDIIAMVRTALTSGFRVNLSSNGARPNLLQRIRDLGDKVVVGISVNDRTMLRSLGELVRSASLVVKTIYARTPDISLIEEILSLEPKRFFLIYRDAVEPQDLSQTVPFTTFLEGCSRFDPSRVGKVFCSGFLPDINSCPELEYVRCPAGTTKLAVQPDGSVYPCNLFFGRKEFLLGNIVTDPFEKLWQHKALSFFRNYGGNTCSRQACPIRASCHGGCPAQSLVLTGTISVSDPRCSCPA